MNFDARFLRRAFLSTLLALAAAALLVALAGLVPARAADVNALFRAWLADTAWPAAREKGVSKQTFDAAFKGIRPNLKLPDLVMPGQDAAAQKKQHQAEFGSPGGYFAEKTVQAVAAGGRRRGATHERLLKRIEQRFGVPGEIVLAVWGRESGFGTAKLPHDAIEVLGTKAFMATRKDMFLQELVAALVILERGLAPPGRLKSSWAGALGQPQFLPTSYLDHAVDFDGDGRVDIWDSVADSLGSIANYLHRHGWQPGRGWGHEVVVPESVSCSLEGPDRGRRIAAWVDMGIARVDGKTFPASELKAEGFLLMPAGRSGPAFIVTPNFYVLKAYNESDLYALFIGHGGDRIAGKDKTFSGRWGKVGGLLRSDVAALQRGLVRQGYDVGGADGLAGFRTRRSIGEWQERAGRAATCFPDAALVKALKQQAE